MSLTVGVEVSPQDRELLTSWTRSPSIRAGLAQRARVVLLAADGLGTAEIVRRVGLSKPAVIGWKRRYAAEGIAGLEDRAKSGRPRVIDQTEIVLATLEPPPEALGVTHWSSRLLAKHLGVSDFTVSTTWKKWGLQPWRVETFKFSTDPELEAKIRDVVGLYLNPPDKAIVLCVDEKSQVQALDRTAPVLPSDPGSRRSRPTTTCGTAPPPCSPRWRSPPARSPTPASRGTATRSSSASSSRSRRPTRGRSCTSSATTTPPTSTRT